MEQFSDIRVFLLLGITVALAIFEIQIEGPNGWAKNLPAWRANPDSWLQRIYGKLMSGKPLDGFHISELAVLLFFFHLPFGWGVEWSWREELKVLSSFSIVSVSWDFLWFILNPAFGWKKFKPEFIWWHKKWLWKFPVDYYAGLGVGLLLSFLSSIGEASWPFPTHLQEMLVLIVWVGFYAHIHYRYFFYSR